VEAPLRQTAVPLQRGQIRSPAQALSNVASQLRQTRGRRAIARPLGVACGASVGGFKRGVPGIIGCKTASVGTVQCIRTDAPTTTRIGSAIGMPIGGEKYFIMVASPFPE